MNKAVYYSQGASAIFSSALLLSHTTKPMVRSISSAQLRTPFTSDGDRKFAFTEQPQAAYVNINILHQAFIALVTHVEGGAGKVPKELLDRLKSISVKGFNDHFSAKFTDNCKNKIGIQDSKVGYDLWMDLSGCMADSRVDWTVFFRLLCHYRPAQDKTPANLDEILSRSQQPLKTAFHEVPKDNTAKEWVQFFEKYDQSIRDEGRDADQRAKAMMLTNPKYIMRNWMMTMAYEKAEKGDYDLVYELLDLAQRPYDEQSQEREEKWFKITPEWARKMPGVSFMS